MDVNLELLTQPFPREAIKSRQGGGGRSLDYVEGHTVIHRLIAATGNTYSFRVLEITTRTVSTRNGDATLVTARVELELPGLGARQHIGVQMVNDAGGEDLVKGAITDALKKAATLFGVGLELYGPDYESGELPQPRQHAPQARQTHDNRRYGHVAPAQSQPDSQPPTAPRQMNPANADEPATQPQIKAIFAIGRKLDIDVKPWVHEQFGGRDIDSLTRAEASLIIEDWQERVNAELDKRAQPVG